MAQGHSPDELRKVRKLAATVVELRAGKWFSITRLTVLKKLCKEPQVANGFAIYLARKTLSVAKRKKGKAQGQRSAKERAHQKMMVEALAEMEAQVVEPTAERRSRLAELHLGMKKEQNTYERVGWNTLRNIYDSNLLIVEYAAECMLKPHQAGDWAYRIARMHVERYNPRYGVGLIPDSADSLEDVVRFWLNPPKRAAP